MKKNQLSKINLKNKNYINNKNINIFIHIERLFFKKNQNIFFIYIKQII